MRSEIRTFSYPGGEIQRVQTVRLDDWSDLDFLHPVSTDAALGCFSEIYDLYLVPARPWMFGTFVMFTVPEGMVYLLGDHRNNSRDSREFGPFDERMIVGKVIFRFYHDLGFVN